MSALKIKKGSSKHSAYDLRSTFGDEIQTHTLAILVDNDEKDLLLSCYKFDCRSCGNTKLKRVISLGYQPLANNLLNNREEKCELYPLEVNYCSECHNCQLSVAVNPKKMFSNYLYTSSTTKSFREHFINAAKKYIKDFKLNKKKSYIIVIGSND